MMKPSYRWEKDASPAQFQGKTKYASNWYEFIILLFGFLMALSRFRDKLLRTKLWNGYMRMTCRADRCVRFEEFEKLIE